MNENVVNLAEMIAQVNQNELNKRQHMNNKTTIPRPLNTNTNNMHSNQIKPKKNHRRNDKFLHQRHPNDEYLINRENYQATFEYFDCVLVASSSQNNKHCFRI